MQLAPGQTAAPSQSDEEAIQFSINPERVGPVLHRLVTPTHTRARIYDSDGRLLSGFTIALRTWRRGAFRFARRRGAPQSLRPAGGRTAELFCDPSAPRSENPWLVDGMTVPEVKAALLGRPEVAARINNEGETIVSVAVPIQYMMADSRRLATFDTRAATSIA